jgi:hypothetical protein
LLHAKALRTSRAHHHTTIKHQNQRNSSIKHEFIMFIVIALLENASPLSNGAMPSNALNSIALHWAFQMLLQHPYPQPWERGRGWMPLRSTLLS